MPFAGAAMQLPDGMPLPLVRIERSVPSLSWSAAIFAANAPRRSPDDAPVHGEVRQFKADDPGVDPFIAPPDSG